MATHKPLKEELSQPNNKFGGIDIDIHRETGLLVLTKVGIHSQSIELTSDDVDAIINFYKNNRRKIAHSREFNENSDKQFDVESDEHWKDEEKIGYMKQKDVGQGHGTLRFKSNTGTTYTVELNRGKIVDLKDQRGNVYELSEIQKYWDKGFPLIGAIAATIGDPDSSTPDEEEKPLLYPPEELRETDKPVVVKEKLPRKRCEKCGKPVNPGISSTKCPSCHESSLEAAEKHYAVQESSNSIEVNPRYLTDIEVDGIDKNDWPDFVDSYVVAANYKGRPLTPPQLEWLNQNHPDIAQDEVREKLGPVDFDKIDFDESSVREGGAHADKGIQISTTALSEEAPPGFPKTIYEKLVIKFKGNKKKINEVMWELHNKSKKTGGSLDEKTPPKFPNSLRDKLLLKYKSDPEKAYSIMWKLHNEHGDKLESVVSEAKKKLNVKK